MTEETKEPKESGLWSVTSCLEKGGIEYSIAKSASSLQDAITDVQKATDYLVTHKGYKPVKSGGNGNGNGNGNGPGERTPETAIVGDTFTLPVVEVTKKVTKNDKPLLEVKTPSHMKFGVPCWEEAITGSPLEELFGSMEVDATVGKEGLPPNLMCVVYYGKSKGVGDPEDKAVARKVSRLFVSE